MNYQAPGVYIRYVTEGPLTIRAASTSTAVFVGKTRVGGSVSSDGKELNPTAVNTAREFAQNFATLGASHGAVSMPTETSPDTDAMGHAVAGFFANGGSKAYIASTNKVGVGAAANNSFRLKNGGTSKQLKIQAISHGRWGEDITVTASLSSSGAGYVDLKVSLALEADANEPQEKVERFVGVDINEVISLPSSLVVFSATGGLAANVASLDTADPNASDTSIELENGVDPSDGGMTYATIFEELKGIDDISLIVLPDKVWGRDNDKADITQGITHAQFMKDRMVLVQVDDGVTDWSNVGLPVSPYASAYYPSAQLVLKNGAGDKVTATIGITGHVAGVIARTDSTKGPWSAAAGTHADVRGIASLTKDISQVKQEPINSNNINALRYINGSPSVWGARTRDAAGIYEYQPVMRTAFLIADSLRGALQQAVFLKNTEVLWANLKASVTGFMTTLYAQGAFQGPSASKAFEVACGLDESMSQTEIDQGLLRVTVRFRAAKPAEFIEVSVEQLFADSL